jgi:hypothetical protein
MEFARDTTVTFPVGPEVTFDYLADPRNRPEWQSSLKSVELLTDGPPGRGNRWVDHTKPGLRPVMETMVFDRPALWAEAGRWHGLAAVLTLGLHPREDGGTDVHAVMMFPGRVWWLPVSFVLSLAAPAAIAADLRRAARLLAERQAA